MARRILVVEDSDCLRAAAVRTLSAGGYAVAEARHGEDALRVIEQTAEPFDLVVTEMILPVMSGYKLGRRLARQRPGLPVLYLSLALNETLLGSATPARRTSFLKKPFLPEELVRQVTESLRAPLSGQVFDRTTPHSPIDDSPAELATARDGRFFRGVGPAAAECPQDPAAADQQIEGPASGATYLKRARLDGKALVQDRMHAYARKENW